MTPTPPFDASDLEPLRGLGAFLQRAEAGSLAEFLFDLSHLLVHRHDDAGRMQIDPAAVAEAAALTEARLAVEAAAERIEGEA